MRRRPASFVRAVALVTAFCALGIAGGCGQATFDLLPDSASPSAGAGAANSGGGRLGGGSPGASGGAGLGGSAGRLGGGGYGGRFGGPPGGSTGAYPCFGEGGCPDEPPPCSEPSLFCIPCDGNDDCMLLDAKTCDTNTKRCVECNNEVRCPIGEACNSRTHRCAKACDGANDSCVVDGQRLMCARDLGVCVACFKNTDCDGPFNSHCSFNECVQCVRDDQCSLLQYCFAEHCIKR